ncbi:L-threonylcarbamoyladenylate synthase [Afipia felis]|uniref:Threonylcarbamoyl-AMP synthase n=2 Tax=Afipia felis TaxID=1035 RepID=A0A380WA91_AFIFE|nr:L-threonylcarbamoyladenylate synthase [Afipia felis]EKS28963.1 Sua5/YciO/YrdC/YwlC family protein [Afipia felis ATCC 53690]SUU77671.1 t(6)A37 threonylcarbamoyladenosine biosynthesis protein RimN [Afipia felis]SUU85736.1 t(6)A37 threonylcarbamoyladenosine biosynthesis protein RimN [Afipia felis]
MALILTTKTLPAAAAARPAAECLAAGGLVAFPTETVYGLGADGTNGEAIARLYEAKGRPSFNPLIAHVPTLEAAKHVAIFNEIALKLARAFWPGPLTLVLPKAHGCPVASLATAGLDTVAVRIPAHPVAQAILQALGAPIVAPSANRSGHVSPTTAAHVRHDLDGRIDMIVDGGPVSVGLESTIVGCIGAPTLLRPGGAPRADIEAVLGVTLGRIETAPGHDSPLAPGMLESHYAPKAAVRLAATTLDTNEALLAFGAPLPGARPERMLNLSPRGDLIEAAANLFGHLRALDETGAQTIAVMPIPAHGLGEAINDRLRRAAADRPA